MLYRTTIYPDIEFIYCIFQFYVTSDTTDIEEVITDENKRFPISSTDFVDFSYNRYTAVVKVLVGGILSKHKSVQEQ